MKLLIEKGLLLDHLEPHGHYLFDRILSTQFENSVLISMIEKGANLNLVKDGKNSFLMKSIQGSRYRVSCALLEGGADIAYRNTKGQAAFDIFAGK